jgi:hypothetical protein
MTNPKRPAVSHADVEAGRRAFLRTAGLGGLALAAGSSLFATPPADAAEAKLSDADILNFALNLEYLEAEFYLLAVRGEGLSTEDSTGVGGNPGRVIGGSRVKFETDAIALYAEEIAEDELAHVRFLRSALGDGAVGRPVIDLRRSFTAAAQAANLIGAGDKFDAFANEESFLLAAFIFEDVGVTAYKGAAPLISNKGTLEAAAGILAVEAYHAATVRTLLYQGGFFAQTKQISDLRDSVDGNKDLDQGIGNKRRANIVPTDKNGLAFSRSPEQVLSIVYLGGVGSGGFFPKGINA